jgi:hypothetical protein
MASLHPETRLAPDRSPAAIPRLDRFGAYVSVAVLMTAATAVFVVRQNLDDHVFRLATGTTIATTGAAVANR